MEFCFGQGDTSKDMDFALFKTIKFTESKSREFRSEFSNLPNHPIFSEPGTIVDKGSGGQLSSTLLPARRIRFALKLYF